MSTWFVLYQVLCLLLTNSGHLYKYIAGHNFFTSLTNTVHTYWKKCSRLKMSQSTYIDIFEAKFFCLSMFVYMCAFPSWEINRKGDEEWLIGTEVDDEHPNFFLEWHHLHKFTLWLPRSISTSVCCKIFTCCTSIISAMVIILDVVKMYMYIYEFRV